MGGGAAHPPPGDGPRQCRPERGQRRAVRACDRARRDRRRRGRCGARARHRGRVGGSRWPAEAGDLVPPSASKRSICGTTSTATSRRRRRVIVCLQTGRFGEAVAIVEGSLDAAPPAPRAGLLFMLGSGRGPSPGDVDRLDRALAELPARRAGVVGRLGVPAPWPARAAGRRRPRRDRPCRGGVPCATGMPRRSRPAPRCWPRRQAPAPWRSGSWRRVPRNVTTRVG